MSTSPGSEPTRLTAPGAAAGKRLDAWLGEQDCAGSRAAAARMIAEARVTVDGRPATKSQRLSGGERIEIAPPRAPEHPGAEAPLPFDVVFEDAHLIVVDKPAGLVVHPAPGHREGTLAQALAGRAAGGPADRPGIVHRLDKDTSGLLVVAKSEEVLRKLQQALAGREVRREYLALVRGVPASASGTIDAPLGRDRRRPDQVAIRDDSPRAAVTHFEIAEQLPPRTLLRVRLDTGRTHQIRVHLAAIGLPVCGDSQYGVAGDLGLARQFLHACTLAFPHPKSGEPLVFSAALPGELETALQRARSEAR